MGSMYPSAIVMVIVLFFVDWISCLKNPIISGFNPDPSIIRVNNTYYLATSSFEFYPAIPIYKSKNLVDWELASHAFGRPATLPLYGVPTGAGEFVLHHVDSLQ